MRKEGRMDWHGLMHKLLILLSCLFLKTLFQVTFTNYHLQLILGSINIFKLGEENHKFQPDS